MASPSLLQPLVLGPYTLKNRLIMAPLTRMRAAAGNVPHELHAQYYSQRASAGLVIAEATQISQQGQGYPATPGIHSAEQIQGWKRVTEAVHAKGGLIFLQLWHVGRISHESFQPNGGKPVSASAIAPEGKTMTAEWKMEPYPVPHALTVPEIEQIIGDYEQAARNALEAGFDGVEIHSANGYLLDQFLEDSTNHRTDEYGGSLENRTRFLMQVMDRVIAVWGRERVGVRLSPFGSFNDMKDSDTVGHFTQIIQKLSDKQIAYLHLIEPRATSAGGTDAGNADAPVTSEIFRPHFKGVLISAGGYDQALAEQAVAGNKADAIAFGRMFIANPDLPERFKRTAALNRYDRKTFYGGGEKGYTDYPTLQSA